MQKCENLVDLEKPEKSFNEYLVAIVAVDTVENEPSEAAFSAAAGEDAAEARRGEQEPEEQARHFGPCDPLAFLASPKFTGDRRGVLHRIALLLF